MIRPETVIRCVLKELSLSRGSFSLQVQEFGKHAKPEDEYYGKKVVKATVYKDSKPIYFCKSEASDRTEMCDLRLSCTERLLKIIIISGVLTQSDLKDE